MRQQGHRGMADIALFVGDVQASPHVGQRHRGAPVMRGFTVPTYTPAQFRDLVYDPNVRAPICSTAPAARAALPFYELRTRVAIEGKGPDQIAQGVQVALETGVPVCLSGSRTASPPPTRRRSPPGPRARGRACAPD